MKKNKLKKTGRYFSRAQLLLLSELTPSQFKALCHNGLIEKEEISPDYQLYEVVFCKVIFLLRQEFSLQLIRDAILDPCEVYKDDILHSNYAHIALETCTPEKLTFCQIDTPEFRDYLEGIQMCIDRKSNYLSDRKKTHYHVVWINLLQIVSDLLNKAIDLQIDDVELKFADFLNQASLE